MAVLECADLEGQAVLIVLGCLEALVLDEILDLCFLLGVELPGVLEPKPAAFLEVGLGEGFGLAYGIHGLIDELLEVKAIAGDLGLWAGTRQPSFGRPERGPCEAEGETPTAYLPPSSNSHS